MTEKDKLIIEAEKIIHKHLDISGVKMVKVEDILAYILHAKQAIIWEIRHNL